MFRPGRTRARVVRIIGRPALQGSRSRTSTPGTAGRRCDTVVFTGDWIPDHDWPAARGSTLDPGTKGPLVDTALRTGRPGVFAVGNLLHPVDTADIAALDGRFAADRVHRCLSSPAKATTPVLRLKPGSTLRWLAPGLLSPDAAGPPRGRLLAWTDHLVRFPKVTVSQGGRVIAAKR